jgi:solute carrier family 35 protein E3
MAGGTVASEGERCNTNNYILMTLNIISSVSIALVLKALFISNPAVPVTTLVVFHMCCAMAMTHYLHWKGWFEEVQVDGTFLALYSFFQGAAIVASNTNLLYNSIGVYQMSKLAVIPTIAIVETVLRWREPPNFPVSMALLVVVIGVGLATVHDVTLSFIGSLWAIAAILCIASVQILSSRQKQNNLTPLQLLHYGTGPTAVMLILVIPFTDNMSSFYQHGLSAYELLLVVLSGIISVSINMTVLMIIGETSPITYQVIGQLKSISLLVAGALLFPTPISAIQLVGIVLAVAGSARYGFLKIAK